MKTDGLPLAIAADNLSIGWGKALLALAEPGVTRVTPMTLTIRGFAPDGVASEVPEIREAVDAFLDAQDKKDSENVAFTIFPQRYLELAEGDPEMFFDLYTESFQRIQDFNPRNNRRGSYFQRLIDLKGGGQGPNQLAWMIKDYHDHPKARRTSKFQATTFDPARDYSATNILEFPCLQQVSFVPDEGALQLNAFYASQQIARKAYGNYLGLARLGAFMAKQFDLRFEQLNVFVGLAQMDIGKTHADLQPVLDVVRKHVDAAGELVPA